MEKCPPYLGGAVLSIKEAVNCDQFLGSTVEVTVEHVTLRARLSIQKHVAATAATGPATNGPAPANFICADWLLDRWVLVVYSAATTCCKTHRSSAVVVTGG